MKAYTAQEWQIKFKEQAGKDKQLLHDLECTALVIGADAWTLEKQYESLHSDFITQSEAWQKTIDKNKALEGKIEAAKQIVDKWCNECALDNFSNCEVDCGIHDLKDLFAVLIPRKESGEKPT